MVNYNSLSILYWNLSDLPSVNLDTMLDAVESLLRRIPFSKVIIVANDTIIPAKITKVVERPLYADIYIPRSLTLNHFGNNTIHKGQYYTTDQLIANLWGQEQLFVIGELIPYAISITNSPKANYSYKDLIENPESWFS